MPKATSTALPAVEEARNSSRSDERSRGPRHRPGAPAPATTANGKKKKTKAPKEDKNDESSSKHKPKKGLDKLNPF